MKRDAYGESLSDRQKRSSEAKSAQLAKLRPKPTVTNPEAPSRASLKAAELVRVRKARREAKMAKSEAAAAAVEAAAAAVEAARLSDEAASAAVLDAKRGERKERKALTKAEAKTKRDARYAARQTRR